MMQLLKKNNKEEFNKLLEAAKELQEDKEGLNKDVNNKDAIEYELLVLQAIINQQE